MTVYRLGLGDPETTCGMTVVEETDAAVISKVLDLSTVETYKVHGVLSYYRLPGLTIINPVPVMSEGHRIGFVTCYYDGDTLVGDFFLVRDTPERLDLENGICLYPSPLFNVSPEGKFLESVDLFYEDRGSSPPLDPGPKLGGR